ncbi:MAG: cadherin-like beta sandwich domain-containing protein, partial [Gammaproteobacteria bacterium]|nr:cadherin-like beta sandwich domain-containing protein [Gammaproteobacteria bacterium]
MRLGFMIADNRVDRDGDGLIELNYLEDLHAIRYQLDGSGYRASAVASKITTGCPSGGCVGYELNRSLGFKNKDSYRDAITHKRLWHEDEGWLPIGTETDSFGGILKGNGYTIYDLTINRTDAEDVALFAYLSNGAQIDDIVLSNVDIRGKIRVGGLVGTNRGVVKESRVIGSIAGDRDIGGLVGYNAAQIVNSFAAGDVIGHIAVGGLVGANGGRSIDIRASIVNSYAINTVRANAFVGGIAGRNEFGANIINSYAVNEVSGESYSVGGLAGVNLGTIINTYASGNVAGSRGVGGLVGDNPGSIVHSYATASVVGNVRVGGLIGNGDNGMIAYSYWDKEVSGLEHSDGGSGFSTADLQLPTAPSDSLSAPYYLWSVGDWHFGTVDQYPQLRYTAGDTGIGCGDLAGLPMCEDILLARGLTSLETLEHSDFSPLFEPLHFNYRVTVDRGTRDIQLLATAYAPDLTITISANDSSEQVGSGRPSSPIALHQIGATAITIEVADVPYNLIVSYAPNIDSVRDIDDDDDGLIEIHYLEDLHAIRYQADGTAYKAGRRAKRITTGCAIGGCFGYELVGDLDFGSDASYRDPINNKPAWTSGQGWMPIGGFGTEPFNSRLKGNGYSISNLNIDRHGFDAVALFGTLADNAEIDGIGLLGCNVKGYSRVGGLVGWNQGAKITNSYVDCNVSAHEYVGGIAGQNDGTISNSYAVGKVISHDDYISGIAGINRGHIINSYAMSRMSGRGRGGGLVGVNEGTITNSYAAISIDSDNYLSVSGLVGLNPFGRIAHSYWDTDTSGISFSIYGQGFDSDTLKMSVATETTMTNVYYGWSNSDWDFGSDEHYPAVKYTNDDSTLLPHQREGLQDLILSVRAIMFPPFGTHIFDYHVVVPLEMNYMQLQAKAIDDNATIGIKGGGTTEERLTPVTTTVALDSTSTTRITVAVKKPHGRQILYKLAVHRSPPIEIFGIPLGAVDEGRHIRLDGSHHLDTGSFDYRWTQISGPPLLSDVATNQAILDFIVPTDAVAKAIDRGEAILRLEINVGSVTLSKDVVLMINKRNNGSIENYFEAPALQNTQLTASVDLSLDADGAGDLDAVVYQWQSLSPMRGMGWRNINAATVRTYKIPARVLDATQYRVLISYADKQGYVHQDVASEAFIVSDLDKDDDGLIEIDNLEALDAIRYVLDGSGYKRNATAATATVGCLPLGCKGYELVKDLDLRRMDWQPIGSKSEPFVGIFKANNYAISNLYINKADADVVGLFAATARSAEIDGIALVHADVRGHSDVGGLVGINKGIITNSYIKRSTVVGSRGNIGGLVGFNVGDNDFRAIIMNSYADVGISVDSADNHIVSAGGLVGFNMNGTIGNSYAKGNVAGPCNVGGLIGSNGDQTAEVVNSYATASVTRIGSVADCDTHNLKFAGGLVGSNDGGAIKNSYAVGRVAGSSGDSLGGLVGRNHNNESVKNSYWNIATSNMQTSAGGSSATTIQLQSPTRVGRATTEMYYGWSPDDWDFGTDTQYPALKYGRAHQACGLLSSADCNLLLLGQSRTSALAQLILLGDASLVPPFKSETFSYRIATDNADTIEFILVLENLNAVGRVARNGTLIKEAISGERISVAVEQSTATLITIDLMESEQRPLRYKLRIDKPLELAISANFNGEEISEGMRIVLD